MYAIIKKQEIQIVYHNDVVHPQALTSIRLFQVITRGITSEWALIWSKALPFLELYSSLFFSGNFYSKIYVITFSSYLMTRFLFTSSLVEQITDGLGLSTQIPSEFFLYPS